MYTEYTCHALVIYVICERYATQSASVCQGTSNISINLSSCSLHCNNAIIARWEAANRVDLKLDSIVCFTTRNNYQSALQYNKFKRNCPSKLLGTLGQELESGMVSVLASVAGA